MAQTASKLPNNGKTDEDYYDPLAREVGRRLMEGQSWKQNDQVGGQSVEELLHRSYRQYHSILDPCDQALVDESGVDIYVSQTAKKCRVLEAFMRDLILSDTQKLLQIRPSPIPEISKAGSDAVVAKLRQALGQVQGSIQATTVEDLARKLKSMQMADELIFAEGEAKRQQKVIADQWTETGFLSEYKNFIHYLGRDPYAVMIGPIARGAHVLRWSGNRMVDAYEQNDYAKAVDPRDHFYSEDARGRGTGKFEIIREMASRAELERSKSKPGWITINIERTLERHRRNAMIDRTNGGREQRSVGLQNAPDSIPAIRHFGKFSGEELRPYGISLQDDRQYEVMALIIGGYTCRLEVNADPTRQQRRVMTAAYQAIPDRIPGFGISQLVRDIERMYIGALRHLVQNTGASSMPMGEVDYSRISRYMEPEAIGAVLANTIMPVDPDPVGGGRPAHHFHTVPNLAGPLAQLVQVFDQMADEHTGLPAALSGQPIGTGANRTFRGMVNLQGNAMKLIQSAFLNIDEGVFHPMIDTYHAINRVKHNFRGDAQIDGSGVSGLLREELARQRAGEDLQIIAQLSASAPNTVPGGLMSHAVMQLLRSMNVPDHILDSAVAQPQQQGEAPPPI